MSRHIGFIVLVAIAMVITIAGEAAGCSSVKDAAVIASKRPSQKLTVISESEDKSVTVRANTEVSGDLLTGLTVKIGEKEHKWDWENVSNPTYYPETIVTDLDHDAEPEVVLILTTGYGTGIRESTIHVFHKDFTEIPVEDPVAGIRKHLTTASASEGSKRIFSLAIDGHLTVKKEFEETDAGLWFDRIAFGNIVRYRVQGDQLIAELSAQVSPGIFIGTVEARYGVEGSSLHIESVAFVE